MEWVYSLTLMDLCMKDNGRMTSNMDSEQSLGITIRSSLQGILLKEKNQEKDALNLKVAIMKETLLTVNSMDSESTILQILVAFTKDNLKTTIWKGKVK